MPNIYAPARTLSIKSAIQNPERSKEKEMKAEESVSNQDISQFLL